MGLDNGGHKWEGAPFSDPFIFAFQERMEEVNAYQPFGPGCSVIALPCHHHDKLS